MRWEQIRSEKTYISMENTRNKRKMSLPKNVHKNIEKSINISLVSWLNLCSFKPHWQSQVLQPDQAGSTFTQIMIENYTLNNSPTHAAINFIERMEGERKSCRNAVGYLSLTEVHVNELNCYLSVIYADKKQVLFFHWYLNLCAFLECADSGPLGMISGEIMDWQITASSSYPQEWDSGCHTKYARPYLDNKLGWCARVKSSSEWLQIDLGIVTEVRLQICLFLNWKWSSISLFRTPIWPFMNCYELIWISVR